MSTWVASPRVLLRRLPDGIVALPATPPPDAVDDTTLLAGTAEELWDLLATPRSLAELAAILGDRHGTDPAVVAGDLGPALAALTERGLLVPADAGAPT